MSNGKQRHIMMPSDAEIAAMVENFKDAGRITICPHAFVAPTTQADTPSQEPRFRPAAIRLTGSLARARERVERFQDKFEEAVRPILDEGETNNSKIAMKLNKSGSRTPTGLEWSGPAVLIRLKRLRERKAQNG